MDIWLRLDWGRNPTLLPRMSVWFVVKFGVYEEGNIHFHALVLHLPSEEEFSKKTLFYLHHFLFKACRFLTDDSL